MTRSAANVLDDPDGMLRARAFAGWFLGDSEWANLILGAYTGNTNVVASDKLREALTERLGADEAERLMPS